MIWWPDVATSEVGVLFLLLVSFDNMCVLKSKIASAELAGRFAGNRFTSRKYCCLFSLFSW